ncbi:GntR family transcriptional regulator [Paracoccus nototheniae]|uniref:GntR family transcriptional regulator n=1 Tax=Paracoccus nototheniae TaxID=2489002 RepID=A0ABW4E2C1_9RHOB|nr:GntR family transcriptional regulator [Paracoccus nototheniae]
MQPETLENASRRAYRELRQAILERRLPADRKLTELGLAKRLGISRTPIREAIKRLLLEGMMQRRKGQGLFCVLPDAGEVREIFDLRLRLESYAAAKAAERATQDQIEMLVTSARRMTELAHVDEDSEGLIARIDRENALFHSLIVEATHSQRLIHLIRATVDISLVTRTFRRFTPDQRRRSAQHHTEIAAAIAARKPLWAERMMQVHILSAEDTMDQPPLAEDWPTAGSEPTGKA